MSERDYMDAKTEEIYQHKAAQVFPFTNTSLSFPGGGDFFICFRLHRTEVMLNLSKYSCAMSPHRSL